MKSITTVSAIGFALIMLSSFTTAPAIIKPVAMGYTTSSYSVLWEKENYDFGEIAQAKPVSTDFTFTNNGDEPIIISDVVTSCGCTVPFICNTFLEAASLKFTVMLLLNAPIAAAL